MIFMIFVAILCSFGIFVAIADDAKLIFGGCILLFFASFMIGFGGKCVERNDNYQGSVYCGPGAEGGGIVMICIGSLMSLAGCATCVYGVKEVFD